MNIKKSILLFGLLASIDLGATTINTMQENSVPFWKTAHLFNPENEKDIRNIMGFYPTYPLLAILHENSDSKGLYRVITDIAEQHQLYELNKNLKHLLNEQKKTNKLLLEHMNQGGKS